jgi:hypothetical protein
MADDAAAAVDAALQEVLREARARSAVARSITVPDLPARAEAWLGSAKDVPALLGIAAAALNCHQRTGRDGLPPVCSCPGHPAWPCDEYRAIAVAVFGDTVSALLGEAAC